MRSNWKLYLAAVSSSLCIAQAAAQGNPPIRIGEINSYSASPEFAIPYRKGWELAVEQINAAGGIEGRMIEVVSRDDGNDRADAAQVAQELISTEGVDVLAGTYLSNTGLAVSAVAGKNRKLFLAAGPLSDAITLDKGNRYTFRLRASAYMHAAMLAEEAARLPAKRWAILAPNYEYGQSAVANFKAMLRAKRPDVEFVAHQWPALGKINAAAVVQRLEKSRPDAIFNATFGADLAKFVKEGKRSGLFEKTSVVSMLGGEPEYLQMLNPMAPVGWIVTGYPVNQVHTPEHARFADAYFGKYNEHPHFGSILGYMMITVLAEGIKKAQSTDSEKLVNALRGLQFSTPIGPGMFRAIDHQSTLGTYVGMLDQQSGIGLMTNWRYVDGQRYLPDESYVRRRRPASASR